VRNVIYFMKNFWQIGKLNLLFVRSSFWIKEAERKFLSQFFERKENKCKTMENELKIMEFFRSRKKNFSPHRSWNKNWKKTGARFLLKMNYRYKQMKFILKIQPEGDEMMYISSNFKKIWFTKIPAEFTFFFENFHENISIIFHKTWEMSIELDQSWIFAKFHKNFWLCCCVVQILEFLCQ